MALWGEAGFLRANDRKAKENFLSREEIPNVRRIGSLEEDLWVLIVAPDDLFP